MWYSSNKDGLQDLLLVTSYVSISGTKQQSSTVSMHMLVHVNSLKQLILLQNFSGFHSGSIHTVAFQLVTLCTLVKNTMFQSKMFFPSSAMDYVMKSFLSRAHIGPNHYISCIPLGWIRLAILLGICLYTRTPVPSLH
jgi:hypothetical protein